LAISGFHTVTITPCQTLQEVVTEPMNLPLCSGSIKVTKRKPIAVPCHAVLPALTDQAVQSTEDVRVRFFNTFGLWVYFKVNQLVMFSVLAGGVKI